jgi:DNA-binding response OmpR family regulator
VPVLVLSNSSREEDRERALELGAAGYLIKADLSLRDLRCRIKNLLKVS